MLMCERMSPRIYRWLCLGLLFLTALAARVGRARELPVVAPDTIRYIEQAQMLTEHPLRAVREEVYHPLHSLAILGVHPLLRGLHIGPDPGSAEGGRMLWIYAAQTVGIVCGSVMAVLVFLLSRQCGARFWGALAAGAIWAVGARTSIYGADGMADMLALCLYAGSLLLAIRAMRFRRRRDAGQLGLFAGAGFLGGLAYLTRPEGLAAPLFVSVTLLAWWLVRRVVRPVFSPAPIRPFKLIPRRALRSATVFAGLGALWLGVAVPAAPYALAIGGLTHKKALIPAGQTLPDGRVADGRGLPGARATEAPKNPVLWVWNEVTKTFGYIPTAVLLLAIAWYPRWWGRPRLRLLVLVATVMWYGTMFWLVMSYGYLGGRHTLPLQVFAFALLGIALGHWQRPMRWWAALGKRQNVALARWPRWPSLIAGVVFAVMLVAAVALLRKQPYPETLATARAATWAHDNLAPGVLICDRQQLVGYYSQHPYARWLGTPADPALDTLHSLPIVQADRSASVLLGRLYEDGHNAVRRIGDYRAMAAFSGEPVGGHSSLYVLYALPEKGTTTHPGGIELLKVLPQ
jgi:hypothetical protein